MLPSDVEASSLSIRSNTPFIFISQEALHLTLFHMWKTIQSRAVLLFLANIKTVANFIDLQVVSHFSFIIKWRYWRTFWTPLKRQQREINFKALEMRKTKAGTKAAQIRGLIAKIAADAWAASQKRCLPLPGAERLFAAVNENASLWTY